MAQSKKQSWIESITNVLVGYFIAVGTQILIFKLFEVNVKTEINFYVGLVLTVVSLVRSYTLRRIFNKINGGK